MRAHEEESTHTHTHIHTQIAWTYMYIYTHWIAHRLLSQREVDGLHLEGSSYRLVQVYKHAHRCSYPASHFYQLSTQLL